MKKKIVAINGNFVVREIGGQERYSYEMFAELDKIIAPSEMEMIVPKYAEKIPDYKNIKIIKYGNVKGHFWEQISFLHYILRYKRIGWNPLITCPILKPDIVTLHDVLQLTNIVKYKNLYGKLSKVWHTIMFKSAAKKARLVLTSSEFSKSEINKYLGIPKDKIVVTGVGWQHFNRIEMDLNIFNKHPEISKYNYYLSASSLTPQKNFKWIVEVANRNPDSKFLIIGKQVSLSQEAATDTENLQYLGYVSDGEMKALMKYCKAFIHPAIYEGFGIPPMEALSVGAKIVISTAACLPEIYGDSAYYIDPYNPDVDLEQLLKKEVAPPQQALDKFSWKGMTAIAYNAVKNIL